MVYAVAQGETNVELLLLGNYTSYNPQSMSTDLSSLIKINISSSDGTTRLVTLNGSFRIETQIAVSLIPSYIP